MPFVSKWCHSGIYQQGLKYLRPQMWQTLTNSVNSSPSKVIIVATLCLINIIYKHSNSLQFLASSEMANLKRLARFISIRQSVGLCVVRKVFHLIHVNQVDQIVRVKLNPD